MSLFILVLNTNDQDRTGRRLQANSIQVLGLNDERNASSGSQWYQLYKGAYYVLALRRLVPCWNGDGGIKPCNFQLHSKIHPIKYQKATPHLYSWTLQFLLNQIESNVNVKFEQRYSLSQVFSCFRLMLRRVRRPRAQSGVRVCLQLRVRRRVYSLHYRMESYS